MSGAFGAFASDGDPTSVVWEDEFLDDPKVEEEELEDDDYTYQPYWH